MIKSLIPRTCGVRIHHYDYAQGGSFQFVPHKHAVSEDPGLLSTEICGQPAVGKIEWFNTETYWLCQYHMDIVQANPVTE